MLTRPRPRIGIHCPGGGAGGPWRYVHSLLAGIDLDEFDVAVLCDIDGVYKPRPQVRVIPLSSERAVNARPSAVAGATRAESVRGVSRRISQLMPGAVKLWTGFARTARRLARRIRPERFDLFHTQNTGCEEPPVAARLAGVPAVLGTFHVDSTYDLNRERSGPRHRLLEMLSNHCLHSAIAVSRAAKTDWVRRTRMDPARVATIHNGIDPEIFRRRMNPSAARAFLGLPEDAQIIGVVGRLDHAKGIDVLLEAAALLGEEFSNLLVVIAGDGPLRKDLELNASQLGLGGRVRFLGYLADVQPVLDAIDVFALPSVCEALGYAFLEAMASEVPVIGTSVGGIPEVIVPGETGFLVPPRDARSLAQALERMLHSTELRGRMGAAGRERVVRHFHERDMVRKTISLYREMLCRRGGTRVAFQSASSR